MKLAKALQITDRPSDFTHNEQIIARLTLAQEIRHIRRLCDKLLEAEPDCVGVKTIRDELDAS